MEMIRKKNKKKHQFSVNQISRKADTILNIVFFLWALACVLPLILVVIVCAAGLLLWDTARTLVLSPADFALGDFLSGTLLLVMGIEFVKMLALHTADAVVDVLLFTIVRQMIVNHTDAVETLLGVAAVAGIFAIKKFLQTREDTE